MEYRQPPLCFHVATRIVTGPAGDWDNDAVAVLPLASPSLLGKGLLGGAFPVDDGVGLVVLDGRGGHGSAYEPCSGHHACESALKSLLASFRRELPAGMEARRAWLSRRCAAPR